MKISMMTKTPLGNADNRHIQAFECYRAFAISAVMFGHFYNFPIGYGVPIFFLISGYLLTASFESLYRKLPSFTHVYLRFMKHRFLRIYPAYLVAIAVLCYLMPFEKLDLLTHVLNIHTFWKEYNRSINPVFWSLGVEFQWYLLAPFVIVAIMNRRIIMGVITVFVLLTVSILVRYDVAVHFFSQKIDLNELYRLGNDQVSIQLYAFAFGVFAYRVRESVRISSAVAVLSWAFLIINGILVFPMMAHLGQRRPFAFPVVISSLYVSQLVLAIVLLYHKSLTIRNRFIAMAVSYISAVSYGLYIWHFPILNAVNSLPLPSPVRFLCFLTFSLAVATVSYYLVEKYFLDLKKR
jgi:peptidoglycan/LPS O-acetylase OafA/YrhL